MNVCISKERRPFEYRVGQRRWGCDYAQSCPVCSHQVRNSRFIEKNYPTALKIIDQNCSPTIPRRITETGE
jgi:hypothetical protein